MRRARSPSMTTIGPRVAVEASLDRSSVVAHAVMERYAARTGLTGDLASRRYLWTDAFAVCNFLGLGRPELARALVEAVHHELGRHRSDDPRRGWISGAADADGEAHPTRGGSGSASRCPSAPPVHRSTTPSSGSATVSTSTTSRSGCMRSRRSRARRESPGTSVGLASSPTRPTAGSSTRLAVVAGSGGR